MSDGRTDLIDRLEEEWDQLSESGRVDIAIARWSQEHPSLAGVGVHELMAALDARAPSSCDRRDALLTALLRVSDRDPLARLLLLHRFLPCIKELTADTPYPLERDEWLALLVTCAFEVVTTYPLDRRPTRIAANIARDFRKTVFEALRKHRRSAAELASQPLSSSAAFPGHGEDEFAQLQAEDLLRWAVEEQLVDESTAALLVLTRIYGLTVSWVASQIEVGKATLRQRRWRAERRIAAALASEVA